MKRFLFGAPLAALALVACGKSEGEIRAEERARLLQEQLDQERARNGEAAQPPKANSSEPAAAPVEQQVAAPAQAASARTATRDSDGMQLMDTYKAYIADADLFNSNGQRITQPWAILRQDRANFHRFGISQQGDTGDSFFSDARNREIMERMVRDGSMTADARNLIVNGGAVVEVRIYGRGNVGEYLDITVF